MNGSICHCLTHFHDKIFSYNTHCLYFTRIKSLKCNDEHIALSGFYHSATKTWMSMFIYKILSCNEKKKQLWTSYTHCILGSEFWTKVDFENLKSFYSLVYSISCLVFEMIDFLYNTKKYVKKGIKVTKIFL